MQQQGGLGRAGVLIECHNLLPLLPFNIHIFAPRPPALFLSVSGGLSLLHCSLRIYNGTRMEMNQYKKMHHGLGGVFFLSLVALPGGGCEVQVMVDLHQVHHNHHQITNLWQLKDLEQVRRGRDQAKSTRMTQTRSNQWQLRAMEH